MIVLDVLWLDGLWVVERVWGRSQKAVEAMGGVVQLLLQKHELGMR